MGLTSVLYSKHHVSAALNACTLFADLEDAGVNLARLTLQ